MTVAEFLVGLALRLDEPPHNDAATARECLDYATIALQLEEDARVNAPQPRSGPQEVQ